MPLRLDYIGNTTIPVEIEGLIPEAVKEKSCAEIERFEIFHGNQKLPLAEFFRVSGTAADERFEFTGHLAGVHWLGAHMTHGEIRVAGTAGRHVGSEMRGGAIHIEGDAGDWLGGEMHGGLIHVRGNSGHQTGAAYRGSRRGMTRGVILVQGNTGNEVGHTMRRGLIAIGGSAGDLAGFNMLAGTILVFGECGIRPGAGMRRGTIGLFGPNAPPLLPTFHKACRFQPTMLALVWTELKEHGFPLPHGVSSTLVDLFHGDLIEGGRGEVLIRAA